MVSLYSPLSLTGEQKREVVGKCQLTNGEPDTLCKGSLLYYFKETLLQIAIPQSLSLNVSPPSSRKDYRFTYVV